MDLSTVNSLSPSYWLNLAGELMRIQPAEIIVVDIRQNPSCKDLKLEPSPLSLFFDNWQVPSFGSAQSILKKHFKVSSLEAFWSRGEKSLVPLLPVAALAYVQSLNQFPLDHISTLRWYSPVPIHAVWTRSAAGTLNWCVSIQIRHTAW
jgi:DNA mismatch repair ATPase MutS